MLRCEHGYCLVSYFVSSLGIESDSTMGDLLPSFNSYINGVGFARRLSFGCRILSHLWHVNSTDHWYSIDGIFIQ